MLTPIMGRKLTATMPINKSIKPLTTAAIETGAEHELEHTDDMDIARKIAVDHMSEDPDYYRKLVEMENRGEIDSKDVDPVVAASMDLSASKPIAKGDLTPSKAKKILHEGVAQGHEITDKQRRYFGAVAGGNAKKSLDPSEKIAGTPHMFTDTEMEVMEAEGGTVVTISGKTYHLHAATQLWCDFSGDMLTIEEIQELIQKEANKEGAQKARPPSTPIGSVTAGGYQKISENSYVPFNPQNQQQRGLAMPGQQIPQQQPGVPPPGEAPIQQPMPPQAPPMPQQAPPMAMAPPQAPGPVAPTPPPAASPPPIGAPKGKEQMSIGAKKEIPKKEGMPNQPPSAEKSEKIKIGDMEYTKNGEQWLDSNNQPFQMADITGMIQAAITNGQPVQTMGKSVNFLTKGLNALKTYLDLNKSAMPTGESVIPQESANGGNLAETRGKVKKTGGKSEVPGTTKEGNIEGLAEPKKEKLSEDDDENEEGMDSHDKPIEKKPDAMHPYAEKSLFGGLEDKTEQLIKGETFYASEEPTLCKNQTILQMGILCKSCNIKHSAALTACPNCGNGSVGSRVLPAGMANLAKSRGPMLRPAKDNNNQFYPGGRFPL